MHLEYFENLLHVVRFTKGHLLTGWVAHVYAKILALFYVLFILIRSQRKTGAVQVLCFIKSFHFK